jgi:hypothetical protein
MNIVKRHTAYDHSVFAKSQRRPIRASNKVIMPVTRDIRADGAHQSPLFHSLHLILSGGRHC